MWRRHCAVCCCFFFSSRRRHTRCSRDWSSDVCSSDLNLIEAASGGRLTPSYFRIGGLMMDLPPGFERRVQQFLNDFPKSLDEFHTLLSGNRIFQKRTQGIGYISAEDAIDWGLAGPCFRGSGAK